MTIKRRIASEDGWVMVHVIVLMVVAIGFGMALLAIVDEQTRQSSSQRKSDAAQTLAEGAISATANVLATDRQATSWPVEGPCEQVRGTLTDASAQPSGSLAAKVTAEVQRRFSDTSPDFAGNTSWRVDVCPVEGTTESRWDDAFLTRASVTAPVTSLAEVWVRGQASVQAPASSTRPTNSRAVVSKVKQSGTTFQPPEGFAVGTGVFSTDLGTTLGSTLTSNTSLVGGILSNTLGTNPLIAASDTHIGVRCGLLTTLDNPASTCLAGSLAGVAGATNALGLGTLNTMLGIDRTQALGTWTMAPGDAVDAWRAAAQRDGVYLESVPGYGNARTKSVAGGPAPCFSGTPTADQVIFIEQVGDGEQYCDVPANTTARMLVVERGAVRIRGAFTGVVYALNKQECTGDDGACSTEDRENAATREVVRIDGNAGKVTGSVWADGAGGAVGIYPSLNPSGASTSSLLSIGDPQTGICGLPVLGPVLNSLDTTLNGLASLVGNILGGLIGTQEQVRYPGGGSAPTGCDLLRAKLGTLTSSQVLDLFGSGGSQNVVVSEHRTRNCVLLSCGPWSAWSTRDSTTFSLPALLTGASPSVVAQLAGVLGATLNNYTAIQYDDDVVSNAAVDVTHGAGPVIGTYRNVSSIAD